MNNKTLSGALVGLLGACLIIVGLILGYGSVRTDGVTCGSALGGGNHNGEVQDLTDAMLADMGLNPGFSPFGHNAADACHSALSNRSTVTWAVIVPGIVATVAGGVLAAAGLLNRERPETVREARARERAARARAASNPGGDWRQHLADDPRNPNIT